MPSDAQALKELHAALDALPEVDRPEKTVLTDAYLLRYLRRAEGPPPRGPPSSFTGRAGRPHYIEMMMVEREALFELWPCAPDCRARKFKVDKALSVIVELQKFKCAYFLPPLSQRCCRLLFPDPNPSSCSHNTTNTPAGSSIRSTSRTLKEKNSGRCTAAVSCESSKIRRGRATASPP